MFSYNYDYPPQKSPAVLVKTKSAYQVWFIILKDFPKVYRYTIGGKIESCFLEFLDTIFSSLYLPKEHKLQRLNIASTRLDSLKFFLQISWENKCISNDKYMNLAEQLEEIGKMIGGWKRGLETKTPAR
ncbi:MAG: four helix bundle protein [Bacteroidetes bacterium]|nr:four helix bundle protein [Bacteroidota bacterium]